MKMNFLKIKNYFNPDLIRLNSLKNRPRSAGGTMKLGGLSFKFLDPLVFYWEYSDIFLNKIYFFKCGARMPRIIDAGAYTGVSTLFFKKLYPESLVTAIEPDPVISQILRTNLAENCISGVRVIGQVLGEKKGKATFFPGQADDGSVFPSSKGGKGILVRTRTLEDFIKEPVDLLKINVEGSELGVLKGGNSVLGLVDQMIIEYHCFSAYNQNLGEILNILKRKKFRYLVAESPSARIPRPFLLPSRYKYFNLIYARKSSKV